MAKKTRLDLQAELEEILGSRNVYFQPPESVKLKYPAIIYQRNDIEVTHADNIAYMQYTRYQILVVDRDPDSEIVEKIANMPLCSYERHYASDNLNHDVFTLYY